MELVVGFAFSSREVHFELAAAGLADHSVLPELLCYARSVQIALLRHSAV